MLLTILEYAFYLAISIIFIYFFLPEILLHVIGLGSWKRQYSPGVSITFDDGPDPIYTPLLLKILARYNIKACFFLLGEKAQKYPEIVKMIHHHGHQIGSHGYYHKHAWLMTPKQTWENWNRSIDVLKKITGIEPEYIRPPWGGFNLSLYSWTIARNKRIVCWNAKGKDWIEKKSPQEIINSILKKTNEGTIILLHDSGGEQGAPDNTLACLETMFNKIKYELKLPLVPLSFPEWSITRRISFRLWEKWEHFYTKINNIKRIDDQNLFRLGLSDYHGPDLIDEKGIILATKGDKIGEIHFDNIRFQAAGSNLSSAGIRALKYVRLSLPNLAKYIAIHPEYKNIKVYLGITLLSRGAKGLGFNVQDYPYKSGYFIALLQKALMLIYHPAGRKRKTESLGSEPKLVWISKEKLINKYQVNKKRIC